MKEAATKLSSKLDDLSSIPNVPVLKKHFQSERARNRTRDISITQTRAIRWSGIQWIYRHMYKRFWLRESSVSVIYMKSIIFTVPMTLVRSDKI